MPFEVGDRIIYDDMEGEILKVHSNGWLSATYDLRVFNKSDPNANWKFEKVPENKIKVMGVITPSKKVCDCGAHWQKGFEDFHALWCSQYKEK